MTDFDPRFKDALDDDPNPEPPDVFVVFREHPPDRYALQGNFGFVTYCDRPERLNTLEPGTYVVLKGKRDEWGKVPSSDNWTIWKRKLVVPESKPPKII